MRKILIVMIGILMLSCNHSNKKSQKTSEKTVILTEKTENFDWLMGKWKRLNEVEGKATFENWGKVSETEYSGIGYTMQKGDTISQELIRLFKSNEKWNLSVKISEESEAVTFNGTMHNDNEFTCENKENDFPNKIKYWKNGKKINALISNSELEIAFEFERLKQ